MKHYICEKTDVGRYFLTDVAEYSSWKMDTTEALIFLDFDVAVEKLDKLKAAALAQEDAFVITEEELKRLP